MLLITGATGHLGSSVADQLLKKTTSDQFIVTSSNVQGVDILKSRGLQARIADFSAIETLHDTFRGVDKLLLISTMDQNRFEQHKNVIDAAKDQGVKHIVYTSLAIKDIETSGVKDLMISHFQTEDYIKKSGLTYTVLRDTMYADAIVQIVGQNFLHQDIRLPGGNGKVPFALRREMGEATANLLLEEGHDYKTYELTGSTSCGFKDIAETLSMLSGNKIVYNNISMDEYQTLLKNKGFPEFGRYLHTGTLYDINTQQYEIESTDLEMLLGRPTTSKEDYLKELFNL